MRELYASYIYLFIISVIYILAFLFFKTLLLLSPGIIFYAYYSKHTHEFHESIGLSLLSSLAFWAVVFPLLKFIPLTYTATIYMVSVCVYIFIFLTKSGFVSITRPSLKDLIILLGFSILIILYLRIYYILPASPGADMATHTYTTRVIMDKNGYPKTYEPIVPIKTFGFSPTGFPSVAAAIGLLAPLTADRAALLLSVLTYPILGLSLYIFLTSYFSSVTSIITVLLVLFTATDIKGYFMWGGNPSVLAIAFLTTVCTIITRYIDFKKLYVAPLALLSIFLVASFETQPVPVVTFIYVAVPILIYIISKTRNRITIMRSILIILGISFILLIPYITSIKIPSSTTTALIKEYSMITTPYSIQGSWETSLLNIPLFVANRIGTLFFILFIIGIFIGTTKNDKHTPWYLIATIVLFLLLLNSKYWVLPLSMALYPDRVLGAATILFTYATGLTIETIRKTALQPRWGIHNKVILLLCAFIWLPYTINYLFVVPYGMIISEAIKYTSVTTNDLRAFNWIKQNTSTYDVFQNNEGDAGIWVPIFTGRKVTKNDSSPQDYDELFSTQSKLVASYVYVGDKIVYPERVNYKFSKLENKARFSLVYQSGSAKIYKIIQ